MAHEHDNDDVTPLFAELLVDDTQTPNANTGDKVKPTTHCLDSECTKKYPSDADDCMTYNPSCDYG